MAIGRKTDRTDNVFVSVQNLKVLSGADIPESNRFINPVPVLPLPTLNLTYNDVKGNVFLAFLFKITIGS